MAAAQQPAAYNQDAKEDRGSISLKTPLTRKRKRVVGPKKPRKSRVIYNFTAETLSQYFHLSQRNAAKLLGVAPITMKRNCKRQGITWPFRTQKIEAAHRARLTSEESASSDDDDDVASDDDGDAETQAARALASMSPGGGAIAAATAALSEAGLMFARLPYLCIEEQHGTTEIALLVDSANVRGVGTHG
ncbi:Winged helix-turn-helix dna-binding domain [Globisporangium polare]